MVVEEESKNFIYREGVRYLRKERYFLLVVLKRGYLIDRQTLTDEPRKGIG